jgi:uncharacterized membrane protein
VWSNCLNNATIRRGVLKATVLQGLAITVPLGVPIFATFALFMGGYQALAAWSLPSWLWMSAAGVVHFVIGRYGNYKATQTLGSTLSTPVQQLSILIALVLAIVFLNEQITGLKIVGIGLVMVSPVIMVHRRKQAISVAETKDFTPHYGAGIFWGAVCAFGYGVSPLFIVLGLGAEGTLADSAGGVLVSYLAASLVVVGLVIVAGGRAYMLGLDGGSRGWFLISTLFVALSQMFRYMALAIAPVTVVVPIQRLSVVFRILFNAVLNREHEILDGWVIGGIAVAVVGTLALTMDIQVALDWLPLSAGLEAMLSWEWAL